MFQVIETMTRRETRKSHLVAVRDVQGWSGMAVSNRLLFRLLAGWTWLLWSTRYAVDTQSCIAVFAAEWIHSGVEWSCPRWW
jgi:hypothetical protein